MQLCYKAILDVYEEIEKEMRRKSIFHEVCQQRGNYSFINFILFFYKNAFMLGIVMLLDILVRLTPQITTIT